MFLPGSGSTAELSLAMKENGNDLSPVTFPLNKLTGEFSPQVINETGMQIELLSGVDTVTPGMQFWTGVILTMPRDITTSAEVSETCSEWHGM